MRRIVLLAVPLCLTVGCSRGPQLPPFKAVVDNKTLMKALVEKQADIVWESVATVDTPTGTEDRRPHTDEEWDRVRDAAVAVTEAGNLLMLVPRAGDEGWMKASAGMIRQGERMIAAIDRKNPKDVFDVGSDLYDSCVDCHSRYMPAIKDLYKDLPPLR